MDPAEADKAALMVTATLSDAKAMIDKARQPPGRVYLLVFDGDSSRMVPLRSDGEFVLGRDPSNQVVVTDTLVSRRHAVLALVENVGFGGSFAAPAVKGVYEAYLAKKGIQPQVDTDEGAKQ